VCHHYECKAFFIFTKSALLKIITLVFLTSVNKAKSTKIQKGEIPQLWKSKERNIFNPICCLEMNTEIVYVIYSSTGCTVCIKKRHLTVVPACLAHTANAGPVRIHYKCLGTLPCGAGLPTPAPQA
jgi:hypothetical protein